ncbi:hypothetical protein J5226_22205 [Lysobacter sp. K5869]|uniref:hypothetical protein n=1 Tax=Lysobacter sp. K5869 TaxID=2820808 RepID=UPI001C061766|nr:hypothetical protein [Lysobacter sp. K5869]QWP76270.1 hypothetical protein J5226_22205 [Lysobacter sp. K5869]
MTQDSPAAVPAAPPAPADSAPLDQRERDFLRAKQSRGAPWLLWTTTAIAVACFVPAIYFEPEMRGFWPIAGIALAIGFLALLALSESFDHSNLRDDLAAGVKLWREGTLTGVMKRDDGESWPPIYCIYVALDGDDPTLPTRFSVPWSCYEAVSTDRRVRIAYAPQSLRLLYLSEGDYEYVAVDRQFDPHPPPP